MLQHEFEQRIGKKVLQEDYLAANAVYDCTDLDKDAFCADWKKHSQSVIIEELYNRIVGYKKFDDDKLTLAFLLIRKSVAHDDSEMYDEAINLIGRQRCVIYKMKTNLPLDDNDKTYVELNLK